MLGRFALMFMAQVLLMSSIAYAQENCANPTSQAELNICSNLSYKQADQNLNDTYQKALQILKEHQDQSKLEEFKEIQRAWLKFRDLNCAYASNVYEGGTITPLIHATCMEQLTKERTKHIPDLFAEWMPDGEIENAD